MMHDRRHEEWLAELATGGAEPDSAETRARLEQCPACADGWAELQRTQTALDRALRDERDLVTALRTAPPAPGEERALATLRAVLMQGAEAAPASASAAAVHSQAGHPQAVHAPADDSPSGSKPRARGGLRPGARWALVAAGLVCAFVIGWSLRARSTGGAAQGDVLLGAGKPELLAPVGEVAAFDAFRWKYALAPGAAAEIVVSYRGPAGDDVLPEIYTVYEGNEWLPASDITDKWPAQISWHLRIVASDGSEVRSLETTARRQR